NAANAANATPYANGQPQPPPPPPPLPTNGSASDDSTPNTVDKEPEENVVVTWSGPGGWVSLLSRISLMYSTFLSSHLSFLRDALADDVCVIGLLVDGS
ncbi:hypothetical protein FRC20_002027, partial [Serendipita sp. 405]